MSVTRDDRQLVLLDVEHGRQDFERSPIRLAIDRLLDNRHIESTLISPGATDAGAARPRFQPYFEADRFKHDSEDTSPCRLNNAQTPIITVMSSSPDRPDPQRDVGAASRLPVNVVMMRDHAEVAAIGSIWGVFCALANGWPIVTTLAQMAVPWMWVAAFVGFRFAKDGRRAAVLGGLVLLWANVAYYGFSSIGQLVNSGAPFGGVRFLILWSTVGLIAGPVAALLGWIANLEPPRMLGMAALATASIAEPLALWEHIDHADAHIAFVIVALIGLTLPFLPVRAGLRTSLTGVSLAIVLAYPLAVVLEVVLIALGQISAPLRLV